MQIEGAAGVACLYVEWCSPGGPPWCWRPRYITVTSPSADMFAADYLLLFLIESLSSEGYVRVEVYSALVRHCMGRIGSPHTQLSRGCLPRPSEALPTNAEALV